MFVKNYFIDGTPWHSETAPAIHRDDVMIQRSQEAFRVKIANTFRIRSESGDVVVASSRHVRTDVPFRARISPPARREVGGMGASVGVSAQ